MAVGRSLWGKLFGGQPASGNASAKAAMVLQADSLRDGGAAAAAAAQYRKALAIDPDDLDVRKQYANMLKDSGQYDDALAEYGHVLAKRPQDSDTYLQLGHLSKLRGDPAAALRYYEQAAVAPVPSRDALEEVRRLTGAPPALSLRSAESLLHSADGTTAKMAPVAATPAKHSGVAMNVSSRELQEIHEQLGELRRELNELRSLLAPEWGSLSQFSARRHGVLTEIDNRWRTFVPIMLKMTSAVARLGADIEHLASKVNQPKAIADGTAVSSPGGGRTGLTETVSLKSLRP